jgi:chorismate synthase
MVAMVLAQAVLEKFGGDSMGELRSRWEAHLEVLRGRLSDG